MAFKKQHTEPMVKVSYSMPVLVKEFIEMEAKRRKISETMVFKEVCYAGYNEGIKVRLKAAGDPNET